MVKHATTFGHWSCNHLMLWFTQLFTTLLVAHQTRNRELNWKPILCSSKTASTNGWTPVTGFDPLTWRLRCARKAVDACRTVRIMLNRESDMPQRATRTFASNGWIVLFDHIDWCWFTQRQGLASFLHRCQALGESGRQMLRIEIPHGFAWRVIYWLVGSAIIVVVGYQ